MSLPQTLRVPLDPGPAGGPPEDPVAVVAEFLGALEARDWKALSSRLAPDVWFRALLPRRSREVDNAIGVVALYRYWFEDARGWEVVEREQYRMAGRQFLRYRIRLRPAFAPEHFHLLEQAGYCKVHEGRIRRLDLVCTGHHPDLDEEVSAPPDPQREG